MEIEFNKTQIDSLNSLIFDAFVELSDIEYLKINKKYQIDIIMERLSLENVYHKKVFFLNFSFYEILKSQLTITGVKSINIFKNRSDKSILYDNILKISLNKKNELELSFSLSETKLIAVINCNSKFLLRDIEKLKKTASLGKIGYSRDEWFRKINSE